MQRAAAATSAGCGSQKSCPSFWPSSYSCLCFVFVEAASCPLVEGLYLQETDSMLQLLCAPSKLRTDILAWICSSSYTAVICFRVQTEMAMFGQELMLCRAGDLDLIRVSYCIELF
uniref:Uncharacterized protein n=1 Tax=Stegastes partitus TaxID=144197 RepID=A0A3B4Z0S6_9TELE